LEEFEMTIKLKISHVTRLGLPVCLAVLAFASSAVAQEESTADESAVESPETAPTSAEVAPAPEPVPVATEAPVAVEVTAEETSAEPAAEEKKSAGVNVDVGLATIYNFRGWNTFAESSLMDQNALFAPSITWSIFDTGLYLGYWGAYQLSGNNKREMVDVGLGHEQDLLVGYDLGLADDIVTLSFAFTYFFYPFADEDAAGTANPSIIEPLVGISIATVIDLGLNISYFHSLQEEIKGLRHAYFNLSAGKSFSFNDTFGMDLGMGLGIKAWIEDVNYNRVDLHFDWSVPIHLTEQLYVAPALHFSWTDLKTVAVADDPTTPEVESSRTARAGDEYMIYASINFGADF
jgi:hypothetical protein